ncbi:MAG TPA: hypothetical protein VHK70_02085 [Burkholderiaceae bacterium]|nr:hypothetical protein [Burkholderiaceae bacterium]
MHLRFNNLTDPELILHGTDYVSVIDRIHRPGYSARGSIRDRQNSPY